MKTAIHVFPFDLFGSPGTRAGAELLGDAIRELLDDNRREKVSTRARVYSRRVQVEEWSFEKLDDYQNWRNDAKLAVQNAWSEGQFLFWLSGNHLGTLPLYDCLARDAADTLVLQFDAHLDIHHLSDCTSELSHGNFLLHAQRPLPRIINVGHRDLLLTSDHIAKTYVATFSAIDLSARSGEVMDRLRAEVDSARRILIDLDCDVFDAAYFPAIAQSLPCGISPLSLVQLLDTLWSDKVIGFAISEFDTARDVRDQSLATLVWLIEWALLRSYEHG